MKKMAALLMAGFATVPPSVFAASGEMGTGIPHFGLYSEATGTMLRVYHLDQATRPFPNTCPAIILTPQTMGLDVFKIAAATLLAARSTGARVRFYAHSERDGGCGVDYVQIEG